MILLQFDGGARNNPGICGIGYAIFMFDEIIYKDNAIVSNYNTNNFAEYQALIYGLKKAIDLNITTIHVQGDSKIIIGQVEGWYKVKCEELKPLYNSVKELEKKFNKITYEHIYRQYNKLTDSLVNEALNNYTGFGKNYKEILLDY
jgi:probable phosphoglycerate mutase